MKTFIIFVVSSLLLISCNKADDRLNNYVSSTDDVTSTSSPSISESTDSTSQTSETTSHTQNKFKIVWLNWDDSVLEIDNDVPEGTLPIYDGSTPTKQGDKQFSYVFKGWDTPITFVTQDKIYRATFSQVVNTYTITWKNYDGSILEIDEDVPYGSTPVYNGSTPTKSPTSDYVYTFVDWSPAVTVVNKDATYTATFSEKPASNLEFFLSDSEDFYIVHGIGTETSKKVVIPETYNGLPVRKIGNYAFSGCDFSLITIPSTIIEIGDYAFEDCSKLEAITIPSSVTSYGDYILKGCKSLISIDIPYLNGYFYSLFEPCTNFSYTDSSDTRLNIPGYLNISQSVSKHTSYGSTSYSGSYYHCPTTIKKVYIRDTSSCSFYLFGSSVYLVTPYNFEELELGPGLKSVVLGNISFVEAPTYEYNPGNYQIASYFNNLKTIVLPSTLTSLYCYGLSNITSLSLPTGLTKIGAACGKDSFYYSSGAYAFGGCKKLEEVNIQPNTVFGPHAFSNTGLKTIYIPKHCVFAAFSMLGNNFTDMYFEGSESDYTFSEYWHNSTDISGIQFHWNSW